MTFKTKFKIGQEVLFHGTLRVVRSVNIYVTACIKEINYMLEGNPPMVASEADLLTQNGGSQ